MSVRQKAWDRTSDSRIFFPAFSFLASRTVSVPDIIQKPRRIYVLCMHRLAAHHAMLWRPGTEEKPSHSSGTVPPTPETHGHIKVELNHKTIAVCTAHAFYSTQMSVTQSDNSKNSLNVSCTVHEEQMWKHFVDTSTVNEKLSVLYVLYLSFLCIFYLYAVCVAIRRNKR